MKTTDNSNDVQQVRSAQVKILCCLLSKPMKKLSLGMNTRFNRIFKLNRNENSKFDLAWTLLKDEGVVYADHRTIGINSEAVPFASEFVDTLKTAYQDSEAS